MFHFIPSWYNNDRTWYDNNYLWYFKPYHIGFDDIINQVKMFDYTQQKNCLLILNYMPNLRYYLHRYDLLEIDYYSVFDIIQNVRDFEARNIDFRGLNWPQGVDFTYTPFLVNVNKDNQLLAKIEFGEEGNLIHIDYFTNNKIDKKYIFDDRGFLSSILYYEEGNEHHQDYLTPTGEWVIREFLLSSDKHVEVNQDNSFFFLRSYYNSMEELVYEKYTQYINYKVTGSDTIIASFNKLHNHFFIENHNRAKLVLSVFSERNNLESLIDDYYTLSQVDLIICDKLEMLEKLRVRTTKPVIHISPFDTRLSLGKSNQVKELDTYFVVDYLSQKELRKILSVLFEVMEKNPDVQVTFISYQRDNDFIQEVKEFLSETAKTFERGFFTIPLDEQFQQSLFIENAGMLQENIELEEPRLFFKALYSEQDIIKQLEFTRLIVDISDTPDLYTQIAGISSGIPQVNKIVTEFVEHKKNGYLIETIQELGQALNYYYEGLSNWNRSLIYSVNKINDYTSGRLVEKIISSSE